MITIANVKLWGEKVGMIVWNDHENFVAFEYDKDFWKNGWNISPIKMPVQKNSRGLFYFRELNRTSFNGVPGLFSDSLPDDYGNELIDAWLKSQGRNDHLNPVEMLCFIGSRAIGALEFEPSYYKDLNKSEKIDISQMVKVADDLLKGKNEFRANLSSNEKKSILEIIRIGTSVGGARAKALIAYNQRTKEVRSGQTITPSGFSQWIIKFDGISDGILGGSQGYGRIEMAYYDMARHCGIEMTQCMLFEENGRAHFMTKRFDRDHNEKKHMQSWSALTHSSYKLPNSYENLFETMRLLRVPNKDYEQLYIRMAFNAMAKNYDDHTKNFAFLMDMQGNWRLSPAYDITYSYKSNSQWVYQHSASINGKRNNITKEDLLSFGYKMGISNARNIIARIAIVLREWDTYANKYGVSIRKKNAIGAQLITF